MKILRRDHFIARWNSTSFHYDAKTRTFSAEASSLEFPPGVWSKEIEIISDKTMLSKTFVLVHNEMQEDELAWVVYRHEPLNLTAIIYND